jgi:hypothetical protein
MADSASGEESCKMQLPLWVTGEVVAKNWGM